MACELCKFIVGGTYLLESPVPVLCHYCGTGITPPPNSLAQYRGLIEDVHNFRLHHTITCPECKKKLSGINVPCQDSKNDLELQKLFNLELLTKEYSVLLKRTH